MEEQAEIGPVRMTQVAIRAAARSVKIYAGDQCGQPCVDLDGVLLVSASGVDLGNTLERTREAVARIVDEIVDPPTIPLELALTSIPGPVLRFDYYPADYDGVCSPPVKRRGWTCRNPCPRHLPPRTRR